MNVVEIFWVKANALKKETKVIFEKTKQNKTKQNKTTTT